MLALDAIVVPASRPAENLDQAITLARASCTARCSCQCSHQVKPDDVNTLLSRRSFADAIVVNSYPITIVTSCSIPPPWPGLKTTCRSPARGTLPT